MIVSRLLWPCLALALLLAACGPGAAPEAEQATFTVALLTVPWLPDRAADYQPLVESFRAANPDVALQFQTVGYDELPPDLSEAGFLTDPDVGADVLLADAEMLLALVAAGLVRDLQPSLDAGGALAADEFAAPVLDLVRWQGDAYALPVEVNPWVLFYNRDLFDAAGVTYPPAEWHWDGFLTAARALAASGVVPFPFGSAGTEVTPFIYQNGGTLVDDPLAPTAATLLDPATVEAVQWYADLALVEGVMPALADLAGYATGAGRRQTILRAGDEAETAAAQARADLAQAIAGGDAAMWLGRLSERGGAGERWAFAWGVVPLPAGNDRMATLASVHACFVTTRSRNPEQAWRWIDHLTQQPPLHGGLPARRAATEGEAARAQLGGEMGAIVDDLLRSLEGGAVLPESLDRLAASWLGGPLLAVLAGEQSVETALVAAQQQAEAALQQPGR